MALGAVLMMSIMHCIVQRKGYMYIDDVPCGSG